MKKTKFISGIAAIATLGAITPIALVTSCNKSVSEELTESDKSYLKEINTIVKSVSFGTPYHALKALENTQHHPFEYKFSNTKFELVFNSQDGTFAILSGDKVLTEKATNDDIQKQNIWRFVTTYDSKSEYSQYLKDDADIPETLEVTGGLDVGDHKHVKNIKYIGNATKTFVLRTYCEHLTIENSSDTIIHLGAANNVSIVGNGKTSYSEYGKVAYLKVINATVSFKVNEGTNDICSVDTFEVLDNNVKRGDQDTKAVVYAKIGSKQTTPATTTTYNVATEEISSWNALTASTGNKIFRLTANLTTGTGSTNKWNIGDANNIRHVVLDLNGHTITDTWDGGTNSGLIKVQNGSLTLMDSVGTGKIITKHPITCEALGQTCHSIILMNGGTIEHTSTVSGDGWTAAVNVGKTIDVTSGNTYDSQFYMYGGSIKSTKSGNETQLNPAIKPSAKGSYVYIAYGDVYGDLGAIVTDNGKTNGSGSMYATNESVIDIVGGTFGCDNQHICINLRRQSQLTIYDGEFTGGTCIGFINSIVTINGGTYVANGTSDGVTFYTGETGTGGATQIGRLACDGSAIAGYWHQDTEATVAGKTAAPALTISKAAMQSKNGNILHMGVAANLPTTITETPWINFVSGAYYYKGSAQQKDQPTGMIFDGESYNRYIVTHNGLWTPVK